MVPGGRPAAMGASQDRDPNQGVHFLEQAGIDLAFFESLFHLSECELTGHGVRL